jgi:GT2 family glycosyltransferase
MSPRVLVSIVTWNSARFLRSCLDSLKSQSFPDYAVSLWDNASSDDTPVIAAEYGDFIHTTHLSNANLGFCGAHNRIIAETGAEYVLVLNPDVVLGPRFVDVLVQAMDLDSYAGSATGKLYRWESENAPSAGVSSTGEDRILDSTGIYFTPNQRHLDRGGGERDRGQYDGREYVFGASGAAAFYRSSMLEEVKTGSEYFDEDFFAYREDADLAWRAQWLGWRCLYVPEAQAWHARLVTPERRAQLLPVINMHSFKNRFLLRVKNMDAGTYCRFFLPITMRDVAAVAYVLAREPTSLKALPLLIRALPRAWSVRRALRRHKKVSPREMRSWFSNRPVARPVSVPDPEN